MHIVKKTAGLTWLDISAQSFSGESSPEAVPIVQTSAAQHGKHRGAQRLFWKYSTIHLPPSLRLAERTMPRADDIYKTERDVVVPAWQTRRLCNQRRSRFCRLPDELLLMILEHTDYVSRQMLRQTCSVFIRIVADRDRHKDNKLRAMPNERVPHQTIWPLHGARPERSAIVEPWRDLLRRSCGDLCGDCRDLRTSVHIHDRLSRLQRMLQCAPCGMPHGRGLFSATQRLEPDDNKRKCIAHEGRVRMCDHLDLGWGDWQAAVKRLDWPSPGRLDYAHLQCRQRAHWPSAPGGHMASGPALPPPPTVTFTGYSTVTWDPTHAGLQWHTPIFDIEPDVPVTRRHLRDTLASLAAKHSKKGLFGLRLCPHVELDDGQLLLPFEPDSCACFPEDPAFVYDGRFHDHAYWRQGDCCRCASKSWPGAKGAFLSPPEESRRHLYRCSKCETVYEWSRHRGSNRVYLTSTVTVSVSADRPPSPDWLALLDPESWGILQDEETRGIFWCRDKTCKTQARWGGLYHYLRLLGLDYCGKADALSHFLRSMSLRNPREARCLSRALCLVNI